MALATGKPIRKGRRWVRGILIGLALLLVVVVAVGYATASRSLPRINGQLRLLGLEGPVTVYRDDRGIPHIEAASEHDLYMAQGFVTAQDRLWQMDLTRRAASGRLAEILGEDQLSTDKFFRALGLRRAAQDSVQSYSPWALQMLDAYAAGINAFIDEATRTGRLPVEFRLLGYKPEPWSRVDSAVIGKFMAYDLGDNFPAEVLRYQLRQKVGQALADELLPSYPEGGITIMRYADTYATPQSAAGGERQTAVADDKRHTVEAVPHLPTSLDLSGLLALNLFPDEFVGSNNWVVSGSMTKSGKPLLANDPHLSIRTPSIWYENHLILDGAQGKANVFGVIFPGAPGVVIGQNERIAWGVTNTNPDVQDLYIEKRNPANPYQFEYMGKWEDAKIYKEIIPVKGKAPVEFEVVVTRHGPIISEVVGAEGHRPAEALALKWTAHQPTPELEAVLRFGKATDWKEFREALGSFQVPTQNFVFASVDGTIAYRANGMIPLRAKGDGLVPVPGWTGEYEWTGTVPFDKMPEVVNPPAGFIVTANNKVVDDAYPHWLGNSWAQPYRATRITESLQGRKGLIADQMEALQVDYVNLQAGNLLPELLPALATADLTPMQQKALAILQEWDQIDSADQPGPLIFHLWWRSLRKGLYAPTMGEALYATASFSEMGNITDRILLDGARGQENGWLKAAGGFQALVTSSFAAAVDEAASLQGKEPTRWQWGQFHRFAPQHPVGGAVKPLGWLLNPKALPSGGSGVTVGAMGFRKDGLITLSAPWRQVVDLGNPTGNSRSVLTPGQSGHFLSPWYDDQSKKHNQGRLSPRRFTDYTQGHKLELHP